MRAVIPVGRVCELYATLGQDLRLVQKQVLAPRMIQSMEILQLPILALEERIEQEIEENPVLELQEDDPDLPAEPAEAPPRRPPTPPPRKSASWSSTRRTATRTISSGC